MNKTVLLSRIFQLCCPELWEWQKLWDGGGTVQKKKFYFEDYRNRAMTPLGFHFHQSKDLWRAWE